LKSFSIFFCDGLIVWRDYRSTLKKKKEKIKGNSTQKSNKTRNAA
jgi:hypothetical protein